MDETTPHAFSVASNTDAIVAGLQADINGIHQLMRAATDHYRERFDESDKRYEQRFIAQEKAVVAALAAAEKAVSAALAAQERAVGIAELNSEKWRSNANEWRGAMDDREKRYVMRDQHDTAMAALQKEVNALQTESAVVRGHGLVAAVQTMQAQIATLQLSDTARTGKGEGMEFLWAKILAIIGALGSVGLGIAFVAKDTVK